MDENNQVPVGTELDTAGGDPQKKEPKEETVAYATYRKVLTEKKSRDERLGSLESELAEYKRKEEESKGNHEAVITSLRGENKKLKDDLASTHEVYIMSKVESAVKSKALELGCVNPGKLLRLLDQAALRSMEVDSSFSPNAQDVEYLVNEAKKENDFLFKKERTNITDADPVGSPVVRNPKPVSKLSADEIRNRLRSEHS